MSRENKGFLPKVHLSMYILCSKCHLCELLIPKNLFWRHDDHNALAYFGLQLIHQKVSHVALCRLVMGIFVLLYINQTAVTWLSEADIYLVNFCLATVTSQNRYQLRWLLKKITKLYWNKEFNSLLTIEPLNCLFMFLMTLKLMRR